MADSREGRTWAGYYELHAAKVWNAAYYSALVLIMPFLNLYYRRLHLTEDQIGILAALSPWISAPAGSLWAAFADKTGWHKPILVACSVVQLLGRSSYALVKVWPLSTLPTFPLLVGLIAVTEIFGSPVTVLSDIAIMSAATSEGHYGKQRMFASIGWGIFSATGGFMVSRLGIYAVFKLYSALTAFALIPVCLLKFHARSPRRHTGHHKAKPASGQPTGLMSPLLRAHEEEQKQSDPFNFAAGRRGLIARHVAAAAKQAAEGQRLTPEQAEAGLAAEAVLHENAQHEVHLALGRPRPRAQVVDGEKSGHEASNGGREEIAVRLPPDGDAGSASGSDSDSVQMDPRDLALWEEAILLSHPNTAPPPMFVTPHFLSRVSEVSDSASSGDEEEGVSRVASTLGPEAASTLPPGEPAPRKLGQGRASAVSLASQRSSRPASARHRRRRRGAHARSRMTSRHSVAEEGADAQHHHHHGKPKLWDGLRELMANPEALPFFAMSLLMGFAVGLIGTFLFLYLDELGGSTFLMGLCLTLTCCVEVPIFAVNGWILRTLGVNKVLHITIGVCVIRLAAYSTMARWPSLWLVLGVEALNGITFACAWPAGTLHCSRIAPHGMQATVQGIFTSLYGGFGTGLGGLFGGFVYTAYGAQKVFQLSYLLVLAGWALCSLGQLLAYCCARPLQQQEEALHDAAADNLAA